MAPFPAARLRRVTRLASAVATAAALLTVSVSGSAAVAATIQTFQVPTANAGLNTLAEGPDGNLYFTEDNDVVVGGQDLFHVGEVTTAGQVSEIPVPFGSADTSGDAMGPTSMVNSGGRLWFLSDVGGSLYTLNPGGGGLTRVALPDDGTDLTPAPGGGVWATEHEGSDVDLFNATGADTASFTSNSDGPGTAAENPSGGIDFGNGGNSIESLSTTGATASYPLPSSVGAGDVYSLVFDGGGNLWYSTYNYSWLTGGFDGEIGVLRPGATSGQTVLTMDPPSGHGPFATDLALGPDGAIWFSWTTTPNGTTTKMPSGIGRLDPNTGQVQYFDTVQSNSLVPTSIAFGGDGNLYFLDPTDNLIGRIVSPSTLFTAPTTPGGPTPPPPGTTKLPLAPAARVTVGHTTLRAIGRTHSLAVRCRLTGAGRCALALQVTPAIARSLGVKVARHAKTVTLTKASATIKRAGTARVRLHFTRKLSRRLARRRSLTAVLVARSSAKAHRTRTVRKRLTLHP